MSDSLSAVGGSGMGSTPIQGSEITFEATELGGVDALSDAGEQLLTQAQPDASNLSSGDEVHGKLAESRANSSENAEKLNKFKSDGLENPQIGANSRVTANDLQERLKLVKAITDTLNALYEIFKAIAQKFSRY